MSISLKNETNKELRFLGIGASAEADTVAGKIFFGQNDTFSNTPFIYVIDSLPNEHTAEHILCASAAVIPSYALHQGVLTLIHKAGIPYLILKDIPPILYSQNGKIALLDTQKHTLIIAPEIETLNLYLPASRSKFGPDSFPKFKKDICSTSFLADASQFECLFETLTKASEKLSAAPITVELTVPSSPQAEDIFCEQTEDIFRAALYGNISIVLKNYYTESMLKNAFSLISEVFCRLQKERREFNGYIKKGIMISSPFYLMRRINVCNPDFICIDIDNLISTLFGCPTQFATQNDYIKDLLLYTGAELFDAYDIDVMVKVQKLCFSDFLSKLEADKRIKKIYTDK